MNPELRARLMKSYHERNMERVMERKKARSEKLVRRRELPSIRDSIQWGAISANSKLVPKKYCRQTVRPLSFLPIPRTIDTSDLWIFS